MTKTELVKQLNAGVVRVKVGGVLKQFTRLADMTNLNEDIDNNVITNAKIKETDSGATIGVFDIGEGRFATITNAGIDEVIGNYDPTA